MVKQKPLKNIIFLKLGGSLITDKGSAHTPRLDVITRLAQEIHNAWLQSPGIQILLGHGSGSFGHVPAKKYNTRVGVHTHQEWQGFLEVWQEADALNHLVMEILIQAGLPAFSFSPSSCITSASGKILRWDIAPIYLALQARLLPVIFGDVCFDLEKGGTILSTEDLFSYLAFKLQPSRILHAGLEPGVWLDFPECTQIVKEITPSSLDDMTPTLKGSAKADVTGGMVDKVHQSLHLVQNISGLEVIIFSGLTSGALEKTLAGDNPGTIIHT